MPKAVNENRPGLLRDPFSSLSHITFAVLALPVTAVLICLAALRATPWHIVSFALFGAALVLLYTASGVYHAVRVSKRALLALKKVDHMMIFVLIAGTYTPICLITLRGVWGFSLLAVIWTLAAAGIVLKLLWINAPRPVSTLIYLGMGWSALLVFYQLIRATTAAELTLILAGGAAYTAGAVFYALKKPRIRSWFGFHEIFHIFVMLGSVLHIILMFMLI
ncbi:MAG: hemolysin III family protein [Firmicutes bacterium]|nr:hemolysin III family protein [Bacillota bacterium]